MIHFCRFWAVRCGDEEAWRQGHHSGSEKPSSGLRYHTHACLGTMAELHLSEPLSLSLWSTWTYVWGMLRMKLPLTKKPFVLFLSRFNFYLQNLLSKLTQLGYPCKSETPTFGEALWRLRIITDDVWAWGCWFQLCMKWKDEQSLALLFPLSLSCL